MPPKDDNSCRDDGIEVPLRSLKIGVSRASSERKRENEREAALIAALALRSYHLPGYSWCGDWVQYMTNNHPLIGICCHHKLHPIRTCMRAAALFGSFVFGLAVTNLIFIWFVLHEQDSEEKVVAITVGSNSTIIRGYVIEDKITITNGMIALWTVGGTLHAMFDNAVWFISSCACCLLRPSSVTSKAATARLQFWRNYGNHFIILVILVVTAVSTFVLVLRATLEAREVNVHHVNSGGLADDEVHLLNNNVRARSFQFIIGYTVEVALELMVYYPIVGTIMFSGVLGCGVLPILGGRPHEIRQEQEHESRHRQSISVERPGSSV